MTTYFTSDTHFGHARIIEHAARPFSTVERMDDELVHNWNARVRPGDTIYHLGDFGLGEPARNARVFARLNGHKHLILGNHDRPSEMNDLGWSSVNQYLRRSIDGVSFAMFHYPMVEWEKYFRNKDGIIGSVNVFGHVHSTPTDPKHDWNRFQYDVGVDNNGFQPVASNEVLAMLRER